MEKGGKEGKPGEARGRAGPYLHGDDPQLLGGEFPHLGGQNLRLVQDGELRLGGAQPADQRQAEEAERSPTPLAAAPGVNGGLPPPAAPRHAAAAAGEPRAPPQVNFHPSTPPRDSRTAFPRAPGAG